MAYRNRHSYGGSGRRYDDRNRSWNSRKRQRTYSGSESGSEDGRGGGRQDDLASKSIFLEQKRFYLDVKENLRGRFIKIAEISDKGKDQIVMTLSVAAQFRQHLDSMIEFCSDLGPFDPDRIQSGDIKSEVMFHDEKKYHIDLKENNRGRFLKVSETVSRGNYTRFQVLIPASGLKDFNDALKDLLEEYDDTTEASRDGSVAEGRQLQIGSKNFYFACKQNDQGRYMSITEAKGSFRNTIMIPDSGWDEFKEVFEEFVKDCQDS